jgi:quercetin dioxygenase-like cupin family protein
MSAKAKSWLLAATAGILVCEVAPMLNRPGTTLATPAKDFATGSTRAFFDKIQVFGGSKADGSNTKVMIIAEQPSDVYVITNTVKPGGHSGWHTHPGPSVVLVKAGTATVYDGHDPTCTPVRYPAGTGFIDAGGSHLHLVVNEGTEPLVTVAFQIVPAGDGRRIDAPAPGRCRGSRGSRNASSAAHAAVELQ